MNTPKDVFELLYLDDQTEAAKQYLAAQRAIAQVKQDIAEQNLVILRLKYRDGRATTRELLPKHLADLIVARIPHDPELREIVASARITDADKLLKEEADA